MHRGDAWEWLRAYPGVALFTSWWTRVARNVPTGLNDVAAAFLRDTGGSAYCVAVSVAATTDQCLRWAVGRGEASTGIETVTDHRRWTVLVLPAAQLAGPTIGNLVALAST